MAISMRMAGVVESERSGLGICRTMWPRLKGEGIMSQTGGRGGMLTHKVNSCEKFVYSLEGFTGNNLHEGTLLHSAAAKLDRRRTKKS